MPNLTNFGLSIIAIIMLGSCSLEPVPQVLTNTESDSATERGTHLPTACQSLLTDPESSKWNPSTETYETDGRWAECMGVGPK